MNKTKRKGGEEDYLAPATRTVALSVESIMTPSNTEPIDDSGEEHGWD